MDNQLEVSSTRRKKAFRLVAALAAGIVLCAVIKNLVCGKADENCPC
jgi:hypothetical protein